MSKATSSSRVRARALGARGSTWRSARSSGARRWRRTDPSGYQKVATFYWDKAYRDPNLTDAQKSTYADKGVEAVNKALELNPAYWEAIIYKGLLYREKAKVAPPAERKKYLDEAQLFQKQAMDLRKEQQTEASGGAEACRRKPARRRRSSRATGRRTTKGRPAAGRPFRLGDPLRKNGSQVARRASLLSG